MDDDTSDPGQDWATMLPFECTEEPIEHATDLHKANITAAEIRE